MFCGHRLHAVGLHKTLIRATPRYPVNVRVTVMSKSEARQKDKILKLRCSQDEVALIQKKAVAAGISTSELLRRSALNRKIMIRSDIRMMNELLRLGGLQKHLYTQMQGGMTTELSKQFSEVLGEIKKAINALDMNPVAVGK